MRMTNCWHYQIVSNTKELSLLLFLFDSILTIRILSGTIGWWTMSNSNNWNYRQMGCLGICQNKKQKSLSLKSIHMIIKSIERQRFVFVFFLLFQLFLSIRLYNQCFGLFDEVYHFGNYYHFLVIWISWKIFPSKNKNVKQSFVDYRDSSIYRLFSIVFDFRYFLFCLLMFLFGAI